MFTSFPVLYDKRVKGFKEKMLFKTPGKKQPKVWILQKMASSNWEYFEDSCSEKIVALFCVRNSYKILANQFDFRRCYFGFR